jgi:ATP-dependent Clp protease adapter protein ClpS
MAELDGYYKIAKIRNISIFVHWSFPAGGALMAFGCHAPPTEWIYYVIAYTSLIIVHEAGHAIAALLLGLRVSYIEISGIGGLCRLENPLFLRQSALVYSAGLIAQLILFLFTLTYVSVLGVPDEGFGNAVAFTFTWVNSMLFLINVLPSKRERFSTDGYVLWKLLLHVLMGKPHPVPPLHVIPIEPSPVFSPELSLLSRSGFHLGRYADAIEIFNDSTTPEEFIIRVLSRHLGISQNEAAIKMLKIHNTGGLIISFSSAQTARRIADEITADARAAGHSFVCRYVSIQGENKN